MAFPKLQNNGWIPVPWAEFISKSGTTEQADYGFESGNQSVFVILVNWIDTRTAINAILGSNVVNPLDLYGWLNRVAPVEHPNNLGHYAVKVNATPVQFTGKADDANFTIVPTAEYSFTKLTILFSMPKYAVMNDATLVSYYGTPRQEWNRYVEIIPQPNAEILTRDKGDFVFAEGGNPGGPPVGQQLTSSVGQFLTKPDYLVIWKRVPYNAIISTTTGRPDNLDAALNSVNSVPFAWYGTMGFPVGTLQFRGYRVRPVEVPIPDYSFTAVKNGYTQWPTHEFDVEMVFCYFNPPPGASTLGHNLAPWRDNKWYKVWDSSTKSTTIFPYTNFTNLFKPVGQPF